MYIFICTFKNTEPSKSNTIPYFWGYFWQFKKIHISPSIWMVAFFSINMRCLYAKFQLSGFETEERVWGDWRTDHISAATLYTLYVIYYSYFSSLPFLALLARGG